MIPYGRQCIDEDDIAAVVGCLQSDWLTQGPMLAEFETKLATTCQAEAAVACNSGTAALHMAFASIGIGPDSTVVVPANTFLATANAAAYLGATVRFCDVDPDTGLMTPDTLRPVLDSDVSLVVPVHFAGQPCDMPAIAELVRRLAPEASIIEDACHAIGGVHDDGSPVGTLKWSTMATLSFHPVKHIAAGEGGAVTVDDPSIASRLSMFRCHGMTKDSTQLLRTGEGPWYYEMHDFGFNYRIPETSCALACSQLAKLPRFVQRRRHIVERYLDAWSDLPHLTLPPRGHLSTSAWHLFCLHIDFESLGRSRRDFISDLKSRSVGSQVHYFPVCLQPYYQQRLGCRADQYPGAVKHYQTALSIPMFPGLTEDEIETVIEVVQDTIHTPAATRRAA